MLRWCKSISLLNVKESSALNSLVNTANVSKELQALYHLRELGWKIFNRIAEKKSPTGKDLASADEVIKWSFQHASIQRAENRYGWVAQPSFSKPTLVRVKLGLALFDLLTTENLDRLNECPGCTGLFLNQGRGVGRRWCRMKTCGNRAKTNRFRGV